MTRRMRSIPLSETTALASKDVHSLRQHAKVVLQRLEQEIRNEEEEAATTAASSLIPVCMPDNDNAKRTNNAASPSRRQRQQRQRQHLSWFDKNKNGSSCGSGIDVDEGEVNDGVDGGCCFSHNNHNNNTNNNMEEEQEQIGVNVGMGRKEGRRTQTIQDDKDNNDNDDDDGKTKKQTNTTGKTSSSLSSSKSSLLFRRQFFDANGFWIARNFCSSSSSDSSDGNNSDRDSDNGNSNSTSTTNNNRDTNNEIFQLKQAMSELVQHNWFPDNDHDNDNDHDDDDDKNKGKEDATFTAFGTDAKSNEARGDPFLESADQISYFVEPTAVDPHTGKLKQSIVESNDTDTVEDVDENNNDHNTTTATTTTTTTTKLSALCKVGHGLHLPHEYHTRRSSTTHSVSVKEKEEHTQTETTTHNTNSTTRTLPTPMNNNPFWNYTTSSKIRDLVVSLGYHDPVVPQSMYIFKNPVVGGAVHSHQDSTFLYTTPRQTCLGLWLALDDATLENGCLWVRPKSHLEPVRRQFIRNPLYYNTDNTSDDNDHDDKEEDEQKEEKKNETNKSDTGEKKNETNNSDTDEKKNEKALSSSSSSSSSSSLPSKLVFRHHHHDPKVTWEGKLPDAVEVAVDNSDENESGTNDSEYRGSHDTDVSSSYNFIPVEVKAGDLVVFCGTLDHFSLPNFSPHQRHTFQLHLVEGPNAGITWSPENWLQYHHHKNNNSTNNTTTNNNNEDEKGGTDNNNHQEDHPNDFLRLLDYA